VNRDQLFVDRSTDPQVVNAFRRRRGRRLARLLGELHRRYGRPLHILDVGGKAPYWQNVDLAHVAKITLQNLNAIDIERSKAEVGDSDFFDFTIGDATNMVEYHDGAFDLLHSNSVIEHVGDWPRMARFAREVRRVGRAGWIQTPAWEFPFEVHAKQPFVHWFANPVRTSTLRLRRRWRHADVAARRRYVDDINMLSHAEFRALFPDSDIFVERFLLLPKSYTACWAPAGVAVR